ncbi:glutaredoxin family protein [Nocardia sp. NPDC050630]|uniref:glutaredoxin family protein n=1 Tax=Nocardia sp. NPDC050630 TaxID=3364321 RepID=UPI00379953E6
MPDRTPPELVPVTVYGKPDCQPCRMTLRWLMNAGVRYTYRDITEDDAAREAVSALGYQALPVVAAGDIHWSGFRATKLERLAQMHASTPNIEGLDTAAEQYLADDRVEWKPRAICATPGCPEHGTAPTGGGHA